WFDSAAISGQLKDSFGFQRVWVADEPGRKGRPLSEASRGDRARGLRTGSQAIPWVAADAFALLPEPRGSRKMAAAAADGNHREAGRRRREGNAGCADLVRDRT